jgi:UDP-N-acetylmuramoyl-tripeptide--D-alanyl-D-alanine ligase
VKEYIPGYNVLEMKKFFGSIVLFYLRILAKIRLKRVDPIIVGLTGSVGKTSLRDAVVLALSSKYKVKKSEKANSESGIPLDILDLHMKSYSFFDWLRVCILSPFRAIFGNAEYDVYVVEMGVDSPFPPKNMNYLLKIVKPQIGVLLNVSAVHSEAYDSLVPEEIRGKQRLNEILKLIATEKGKLLESLPKDGYAVANIDNPYVQEVLTKTRAQKVTFGEKEESYIKIEAVDQVKNIFRVKLLIDDKSYSISVSDTYLSQSYGYNFAAAVAVARSLGIKVEHAVKSLENYNLPPGRMSVFEGVKNSIILDSSYNASKLSMLEAFDLAKKLSQGVKSTVILALGDMREMGDEAQMEHEEIAGEAIKIADRMVLVGNMMKKYFIPRVEKLGFPMHKIYHFNTSREAGDFIKSNLLKEGDVVLAKGSQNTIFMENIVENLLKNNADKTKLCRRGKYWDKIRSRY